MVHGQRSGSVVAAHRRPEAFLVCRQVKKLAEELALHPFQDMLSGRASRLSYDQHRLIAFLHERAVWREPPLPFRAEFHHRGFLAKDKVDIVLVEGGQERRYPFDPGLFQYRGELASMKRSRDWGYAGLRLLARLPSRPHYQEFCSFLGASYFRAICTDQVYGASARGLAVNIGLPQAEEFPSFRNFWIERPTVESRAVRVWALLDGPSVTGAYEFLITPGLEQTTLDIDSTFYFRRPINKLGVAPMSTAWGAGGRPASDPRPQVHDSDGLLIAAANREWLLAAPLGRPGVREFISLRGSQGVWPAAAIVSGTIIGSRGPVSCAAEHLSPATGSPGGRRG